MSEQYQKLLQDSLENELRVLNAHIPGEYKTLDSLLSDKYPAVACNDGTSHLFKHKELEYLAGLITEEERKSLLLPVMIEVNPGKDEISIVCRGEIEGKIFKAILGMPVAVKQGRIPIHKPQLALIRKQLKTTTQYLFSPKILSQPD